MLKLGIYPDQLYWATFIRQYGLCCCNMALVSFRLFCKNWDTCETFSGQMVYRLLPLPGKKFPVPLCVHSFQFKKKVFELNATMDQSSDRTVKHLCLWLHSEWARAAVLWGIRKSPRGRGGLLPSFEGRSHEDFQSCIFTQIVFFAIMVFCIVI